MYTPFSLLFRILGEGAPFGQACAGRDHDSDVMRCDRKLVQSVSWVPVIFSPATFGVQFVYFGTVRYSTKFAVHLSGLEGSLQLSVYVTHVCVTRQMWSRCDDEQKRWNSRTVPMLFLCDQ